MTARITLYALLVSLIGIGPIFGQYYPQQTGQQNPPAASQQPRQQHPQIGPQRPTYPANQRPAQPTAPPQGVYRGSAGQPMPPGASAIVPQNTPTLQRRAPQPPASPFQLSPTEQAELESVLKRWEVASLKHKRIVIEFFRFEFKPDFSPAPGAPLHIDQGKADLTSSGKWSWNITGEIVNQKLVEGQRAERMVFDGNSIYEFNYSAKTVTQHVLAEDMKGEDMVRAMLPFMFGTNVAKLKERYFIRLSKFPNLPEGHVCIDACPRFLDEARNYKNARMIVDMTKMEPTGLMLILPNGKDSYRYQFTKVDINPRNPLDLINDPFKVKVSSGWKTYVEQMPGTQMSKRPVAGSTRQ